MLLLTNDSYLNHVFTCSFQVKQTDLKIQNFTNHLSNIYSTCALKCLRLLEFSHRDHKLQLENDPLFPFGSKTPGRP